MLLYVPGVSVFLDVDDLKDIGELETCALPPPSEHTRGARARPLHTGGEAHPRRPPLAYPRPTPGPPRVSPLLPPARRREDGDHHDLRLEGLLQVDQLPARGGLHREAEQAHHAHARPGQGRRAARLHQGERVPGAPAQADLHVPRRGHAAQGDHVAPHQGLPAREPQAAHRADAARLRHLRQPARAAALSAGRDLGQEAHVQQEGALPHCSP